MRLALIICNRTFDYLSERVGCEKDISGMRDLLENLGYSVVIKENLTAQVMALESGMSWDECPSFHLLPGLLPWRLSERSACYRNCISLERASCTPASPNVHSEGQDLDGSSSLNRLALANALSLGDTHHLIVYVRHDSEAFIISVSCV